MEIWNEEVFGPVLSVMTFRDEEEGIQLANSNRFGLGGAIFSEDEEQQRRVARGLECGIVWINCSQPCFSELPWGGQKESGIGRDLGEEGLASFLEPKQIVQPTTNEPLGWYIPSKL